MVLKGNGCNSCVPMSSGVTGARSGCRVRSSSSTSYSAMENHSTNRSGLSGHPCLIHVCCRIGDDIEFCALTWNCGESYATLIALMISSGAPILRSESNIDECDNLSNALSQSKKMPLMYSSCLFDSTNSRERLSSAIACIVDRLHRNPYCVSRSLLSMLGANLLCIIFI